MKRQYIVSEHGYLNRCLFYKYVHDNYKIKDVYYDKEYMCRSKFPFVVDLKKKILYVCESITCCALASQNKRIIIVKDFKEGV